MKAYAQRLAAALPKRCSYDESDCGWLLQADVYDGEGGATSYEIDNDSELPDFWAVFGPFATELHLTPADLDQSLPMLESLADAVCRRVEK